MQLLEVLQHSPDSENYKLQDKQIKFETQKDFNIMTIMKF
jgi:hypothetical protein